MRFLASCRKAGPTRQSTRTLRDEAAQPGDFYVVPRKYMSSLAASAFPQAAVSPAPTLAVSPPVVPSVAAAPASASPCVRRFPYAFGVMPLTFPLPLRLARQAPVSGAGRIRPPVRFGRPLSLGRSVVGGFLQGFSTSARRGRRIASADFCPTASACCLGSFVRRALGVTVAETFAPVQPLRGPTRRSTPFPSVTGRCAMKPRSAGHLQRSASQIHRRHRGLSRAL